MNSIDLGVVIGQLTKQINERFDEVAKRIGEIEERLDGLQNEWRDDIESFRNSMGRDLEEQWRNDIEYQLQYVFRGHHG